MTTAIARSILMVAIVVALLVIGGCSSHYTGYSSDGGRAYYDQYLDRPGYYDFGKPVIFVPDDSTGIN